MVIAQESSARQSHLPVNTQCEGFSQTWKHHFGKDINYKAPVNLFVQIPAGPNDSIETFMST